MLTILLSFVYSALALASNAHLPEFAPCDPVSEPLNKVSKTEPDLNFCSKWNPDFPYNGSQCCGKVRVARKKRRGLSCSSRKSNGSYCSEMTPEQHAYTKAVLTGKVPDILEHLTAEIGKRGDQSFCTVNNGFLANGRRIIPTELNRIEIRSPTRCIDFGTDEMAAMLEWLGREIGKNYSAKSYSGVHLVVGDISAPRGGCLLGLSGRRGHASHTSGQDVDVGFLTVKAGARSPAHFHRQFDLERNWWFIKQIFKNPFACVKVMFLDKLHIRHLAKFAKNDPDWSRLHRFIRHMPGHKNHIHIRIGDGSGKPGCTTEPHPEREPGENVEFMDPIEAMIKEQLQRNTSSIHTKR